MPIYTGRTVGGTGGSPSAPVPVVPSQSPFVDEAARDAYYTVNYSSLLNNSNNFTLIETGVIVERWGGQDLPNSYNNNKWTTVTPQQFQIDWNETDTQSPSYINNKPTDLTELSNHSVEDLSDISSKGSGSIITQDERDILTDYPMNTSSVDSLVADSIMTQTPTGLNQPMLVEFGAAQIGTDMDISATGVITIKEPLTYFSQIKLQVSRASNQMKSIVLVYVTIELLAQPNVEYLIGHPWSLDIDGNANSVPISITALFNGNVGDKIRYYVERDGAGSDDGFLESRTPDRVIASGNIPVLSDTSSASITVKRSVLA